MKKLFLIAAIFLAACQGADHKKNNGQTTDTLADIIRPKIEGGSNNDNLTDLKLKSDSGKAILKLKNLKVADQMYQVSFSKDGNILFYYDARAKTGKININGQDRILNTIGDRYRLLGNDIVITVTNIKWKEMESDCAYGAKADVVINAYKSELKLTGVDVQDCQQMMYN